MEREHINPTGIFRHPAFTRIVTVKGPMKIIFIAGQTPSDENYQCIAPGDYRAQYIAVMDNLQVQLEAAEIALEEAQAEHAKAAALEERDNKSSRAG